MAAKETRRAGGLLAALASRFVSLEGIPPLPSPPFYNHTMILTVQLHSVVAFLRF